MPTWMPTGRVRPDAPLLLSHVVLAEFDIDKGSTVRLQYPSDVPHVSPDWLAEHMIPEGAHAREMDVTYMFLNRQGESYLSTCCSSSSIDDIDNSNEEGYMLYGINVVCTKFDSSIKRGAATRSLSLFSMYPEDTQRFQDFDTPSLVRVFVTSPH